MDFVSPIIDVVSYVTDCSTKHLNYLCKLEENLDQLKEKMAQLNALYNDVNKKVITEEVRLMKRTNQVDVWMERVKDKHLEVDRIILEGTQHIERTCLSGCCPKNCWSSYKLGKEVVKKLILVEELKGDGVFEILVENPPLGVAQELPETTPIVGLDSIFDRAWNFLGENSVKIMGLYGMGGVGKTTLLKRINNEFSKRGSYFDIVIWVVIAKEVNMARVQKEIGDKLGLSVSLSTASNIFSVLNKKKFLLLLDDIWQRIDLLSIGVPSPSMQNKSKIVFTTRSEDVCGRMEADEIIRVECLNWDAAWTLFQEKVGYTALSYDSDIPKLAEIVAKECLGLPLALITIGRSMTSKKTRHEWEHAISVLKNSAAEFPGMGDDVLPLLKFSYDSLPNDIVRLCFLFCSLFPEDHKIRIKGLIEQWIGEGYISGYDNIKEALNEGYAIIGILKRACLLEEADMENVGGVDKGSMVKMHDVIRDLALWIACECGRERGKYFVKAGVGLIEGPHVRRWPTRADKISLHGNKITQLKNIPNCPNLSTLLVSGNETLTYIHNDFFHSMSSALRFLDLSSTAITEVPSSICELFELEFLDLSRTQLKSLPYQMRNLTKLKYLSLRMMNENRCKIPSGIIRNLSNLEFLMLDVIESEHSNCRFEIDELGCLKELKYLEITIYSNSKDVEKCLRSLQIANCTRDLRIITCNDITSLSLSASSSSSSSDLCLGHLKELQCLYIRKCSDIKELKLSCVNKKAIELGGLCESLKKLVLHNLPKLIVSWDAKNLYCAHFRELHWLELKGCADAMVDLTWLLFIPKLQTLWIKTCNDLEEILSSSSDESGRKYSFDENTIFSNLKTLRLHKLPNLWSICRMGALPFPSLKTVSVKKCPKLTRLPLDSNSANNTLEMIKGEEEWWDRLEWENETIKPHFAKFYSRPL